MILIRCLPIYNVFAADQKRIMSRDIEKVLDVLDIERIECLNLNSGPELNVADREKLKNSSVLPPAISVSTIPTAMVQPSILTHQNVAEIPRHVQALCPILSYSSNGGQTMTLDQTTRVPEMPFNNPESSIYSVDNFRILEHQSNSIFTESQSISVDMWSLRFPICWADWPGPVH